MLGVKFRCQQIIVGFVVDFYCERARLVIEVDGKIHDSIEQYEKDVHRCKVFNARGLKEIRFKNEQIINNCDSVIDEIKNHLI